MKEIYQAIRPLWVRLGNMFARGTISRADSAKKMQSLQIRLLSDEVKDDVEHFEPYGFTSNPKPGAEHVTGFFDGDRSHGVVLIAADRRYRLTGLESGEVAIYTDEGDKIELKRGNTIRVTTNHYEVQAANSIHFETNAFSVIAASYSAQISGSYGVTANAYGVTSATTSQITGGLRLLTGDIVAETGDIKALAADVIAGSIRLKLHYHIAQGATAPTSISQS